MDNSLQPYAPPEQPPNTDPAEAAFADLSAKVEILETLLRGLAARREAMPDYSETLGEIAALLEKMRRAINTMAGHPVMKLTPDAMAAQIVAAGETARARDNAAITRASDRIDRAVARIEYLEGRVADAREQRRQRHLWGIGGALAGMLLWSAAPGFIARALPDGWRLPERMAARTMDLDRWAAGERLLATAEPERWQTVVFANAIVQENRDAIVRCRTAAAKKRKPTRCAIEIKS